MYFSSFFTCRESSTPFPQLPHISHCEILCMRVYLDLSHTSNCWPIDCDRRRSSYSNTSWKRTRTTACFNVRHARISSIFYTNATSCRCVIFPLDRIIINPDTVFLLPSSFLPATRKPRAVPKQKRRGK